MKLNDALIELSKNPLIVSGSYKYQNRIELSGLIVRKPKFIKHDKTGIESCSFILQIINNVNGEIKLETFSCMTFVRDLVEQLKNQEKVIFVSCIGKLMYSPKVHGNYTQITYIETLCEFDMELAPEWGKDKE